MGVGSASPPPHMVETMYFELPHFAHDTGLMQEVMTDFGLMCSLSDGTQFEALLFHGDKPYLSGDMLVQENSLYLAVFTGVAPTDNIKEGDTVTVNGLDYIVRETPISDYTGLTRIYLNMET